MEIHRYKIYNIKEVTEVTSLGKTRIYEGVNKGSFPKPVRIAGRRVGWKGEHLIEWVNSLEQVCPDETNPE